MSRPPSIRTGLTSEEIKQDFRENLRCGLGRAERFATRYDKYYALALTVRDRLLQRTVESMQTYGGANARRVAYLSAEYLPGPHLANNLLNLGITDVTALALRELGHDLDELIRRDILSATSAPQRPGLWPRLGWSIIFVTTISLLFFPALRPPLARLPRSLFPSPGLRSPARPHLLTRLVVAAGRQ